MIVKLVISKLRKKMIENNKKKDENDEEKNENIDKEVYSSDSELYPADDEDNDKGDIYSELAEDDSGDDNPDKVIIPNFNNSFAEFEQFVELSSLDRANPQFDKIMKSK